MKAEELAKNNKDYWYGRIQEIGNTNPALLSEEIINHLESQLKEKDRKFTHFEDNNGVSHGGLNDDAIKHIFDEGVLKWYVDYEDERVYLNLKN